MTTKTIKCWECSRLKEIPKGELGFRCEAYPEGIPQEILEGTIDHTRPYMGDRDLQFKPL